MAAEKKSTSSAWTPLGHSVFAVLWVATVLSNVGTWMHDVGAGWLMTELSPSPLIVAGVQAATTLPIFLFALPAGAIADIVDRRKLLLWANLLMTIAATMLAALVYFNMITPTLLLLFTFLLGAGAAFQAPAWQAIVPALVPKSELSTAVALNSMGINISRAIGPALAGFLVVSIGIAAPFVVNALSFIGIIAALIWWRSEAKGTTGLPPEHIGPAMWSGVRYASNSRPLQMTLLRAAAFFVFVSAFWAMLPLISKQLLNGGPTLYGFMLAAVGAGAVLGALVLPKVRTVLGPNLTVAIATAGAAGVMLVLALVPNQSAAVAACGATGACWIAVLSTFNVSAQTALPNWVRARGLSIYLTVFFGSMALGSLVWGQVANIAGISTALMIAAAGVVVAVALTWRAKLNLGDDIDFSPSSHWPEPVMSVSDPDERGPVMIQVRYEIDETDHDEFTEVMSELKQARRRNGGFDWSLMQDAADPNAFTETWFEASWLDHRRHHERVSQSDKAVQDRISALHRGIDRPAVTHHLAATAGASSKEKTS